MQEFVGTIASLSGVIEKGGIVGVLMLAAGFLGWWSWQLRKQLHVVYRQRDYARSVMFRYKGALDAASIKVDISDIEKTFADDKLEGVSI